MQSTDGGELIGSKGLLDEQQLRAFVEIGVPRRKDLFRAIECPG